ncbi:MAG: hypothetical protein IH957_09130 [Chloroflexi bacterium]|nr:hypothetical protein [Chloroflexota bacterium]
MKKFLFMVAVVVGVAAAVRRLVPAERRAEFRESLAHAPGAMMEHGMEMMPEDSLPKVVMSSMRRFEEQNDELAALLRKQNRLLKKQNTILEAAVAGDSSE